MIRDAIRRRRSFNVVHLATMFKADVFVSRGDAWAREEMARATTGEFDTPDGKLAIRFASRRGHPAPQARLVPTRQSGLGPAMGRYRRGARGAGGFAGSRIPPALGRFTRRFRSPDPRDSGGRGTRAGRRMRIEPRPGPGSAAGPARLDGRPARSRPVRARGETGRRAGRARPAITRPDAVGREGSRCRSVGVRRRARTKQFDLHDLDERLERIDCKLNQESELTVPREHFEHDPAATTSRRYSSTKLRGFVNGSDRILGAPSRISEFVKESD